MGVALVAAVGNGKRTATECGRYRNSSGSDGTLLASAVPSLIRTLPPTSGSRSHAVTEDGDPISEVSNRSQDLTGVLRGLAGNGIAHELTKEDRKEIAKATKETAETGEAHTVETESGVRVETQITPLRSVSMPAMPERTAYRSSRSAMMPDRRTGGPPRREWVEGRLLDTFRKAGLAERIEDMDRLIELPCPVCGSESAELTFRVDGRDPVRPREKIGYDCGSRGDHPLCLAIETLADWQVWVTR